MRRLTKFAKIAAIVVIIMIAIPAVASQVVSVDWDEIDKLNSRIDRDVKQLKEFRGLIDDLLNVAGESSNAGRR